MGNTYQTRVVSGNGVGLPTTGGIIKAEHLNNEFDSIVGAFSASTGHTHNGADSARITKLGTNEELQTATTSIFPGTATIDIGTSGAKFRDAFISGTVTIDTALKTPTIADTTGNEAIKITATGSAVNEFTVANAATGGDVTLSSTGDDTNISIAITPKGAGLVKIAEGDLAFGSTAITATAAELNVLDGSATTQATVTLQGTDGVVISDTNTMTQALVSDFDTYIFNQRSKDQDAMTDDSDTHFPTQQSVKAYVDSGSTTMTNKNISADDNPITELETDNFKTGAIDTDLTSVSANDDTLASAKAIKTYVDAQSSNASSNMTGVTTADMLAGNLGTSSSPIVITVTVASKSGHPYQGVGSTYAYVLNGKQSPALRFHGADSSYPYYYEFDQSDGTNSSHPLRFYLDAAKTTPYTTGVTTSGTAGSNGKTIIAVDKDTPNILYYQCSSHAYMGNVATTISSKLNNGALLSLPTTEDTLVGKATSDTLTNKTIDLTDNSISGTTAEFNTALSDGSFATLAGSELLTNKQLNNPQFNEAVNMTASSTELNKLDGVTASTSEINYLDITTLGTSENSKVLTTDSSGDTIHSGEFRATSYNETGTSLTSNTSVTVKLEAGNVFFVTAGHNITFSFSNPPASPQGYGFTLKVTQDGSGGRSLTWPSTVRWPSGNVPTLTGTASSVEVFTFFTHDGGSNYYGFHAGTNLSGSGGTSS